MLPEHRRPARPRERARAAWFPPVERSRRPTHDGSRHFAPSLLRTTATRASAALRFAGQYAKYGPLPAGVRAPSMAVKTLRPRKKGNPQSKDSGCPGCGVVEVLGPPRFPNAELLVARSVCAFAMAKLTCALRLLPFPWFAAESASGAAGQ